jgi:hypothetical protein
MSKSYKGVFRPKNPSKYKGDPSNIIFRSSWELRFMTYLDAHRDVIEWSSEEFCIPYKSPIDGRYHRYFPDFWIRQRNRDGKEEVVVVEIKPEKQTQPPVVQFKRTKRYIQEVMAWGVNNAKWNAANNFCKDKRWQFKVLTEHHLGIEL